MIERQQTTWMSGSLALGLLLALLVVVILPLAMLLIDAVPQTPAALQDLRDRLAAAPLQHGLLHSLGVALLACGLAAALAVPTALSVVRILPRLRTAVSLLGLLPLAIPPFLGAALLHHFTPIYNDSAAAALLGRLDIYGSSAALSVVYAVHYFPFMLFCLIAGLERVEPHFEESARNLGTGRLRIWGRIVLPLATPYFVMGSALMVLKIVEDIGAPLVLGIDTLLAPQLLSRLAEGGLDDPQLQVTTLALFVTALVVGVLAWPALLPPTLDERHADPGRIPRHGAPGILLAALALLGLALVAMLPLVGLGLLSAGGHAADGGAPGGLLTLDGGTITSLLYVTGTGLLVLLTGLAAGVAATTRAPLAYLMRTAATALFAIPGVVLALGFLHLGEWLGETRLGAPVLAWVALGLVVGFKQLPLAQRVLAGPMRRLRGGSMDAARALGAAGPGLYLGTAVSALAGKMGAVFLLGAAAAALELSAALILFEGPEAPYAMALFEFVRGGGSAALWAAAGIPLAVVVAAALVAALQLLRRRGIPSHTALRPRQPARETT